MILPFSGGLPKNYLFRPVLVVLPVEKLKFLLLSALVGLIILFPSFSTCSSDAECSNGENCAVSIGTCYLSDYTYNEPTLLRVPLGEKKAFSVLLASPLKETREVKLSFSGEGKYFAKFVGGGNSISVIVGNDTRRIPITFTGGAIGAYSVCIDAVDSKLSEINNTHPTSKSCTSFLVESGRKGIFAITTPSIGILGIALLGLLGGIGYSYFGRKGEKK